MGKPSCYICFFSGVLQKAAAPTWERPVQALLSRQADPAMLEAPVESIMTRDVCSVDPDTPLAGMLGLSEVMPEPNAVLIDFDDGIKTEKTETVEYGRIQRFTSNAPIRKKLLIIVDSFSEYYLRSAIHDIGEILFVTYGELYRVDLAAEAPDYVVVMLVERNLPFLVSGFY